MLLDLMMPRTSGMDVLDELVRRDVVPDLPVIIVTAANDGSRHVDALGNGAADLVMKPIDRHQLLARLRNVVALKRVRDKLRSDAERLEVEVHRSQEAKERLQDRLEAATNLLPILYYDGRLVDEGPNPLVVEWMAGNSMPMFGRSIEELITGWINVVHPDEHETVMKDLQDTDLRAVLHHEVAGSRHRSRPCDLPPDRRVRGGTDFGREPAGQRDGVHRRSADHPRIARGVR